MATSAQLTVEGLAELLERQIKGGTLSVEHPVDKRELVDLLRAAAAGQIQAGIAAEARRTGNVRPDGSVITTVRGLELIYEPQEQASYVELPALPVIVAGGAGLQSVAPTSKASNGLPRLSASAARHLGIAGKSMGVFCWQEGLRVYVRDPRQDLRTKPGAPAFKQVNVSAAFAGYTSADPDGPLPDSVAFAAYLQVVQALRLRGTPDLQTDQNPAQAQGAQ